ncbi:PIR Superfamily Protein [Plasmodium ovale curtisi]|uniref:PIR Superfamily Protein n=1 Tax=Plasmodium ovale curtisi TaxID=864141 RepID=A0A1A8VK60_PLAOA|nr:PIR Superfamily Protein [Plasmodium ovale curtisi]
MDYLQFKKTSDKDYISMDETLYKFYSEFDKHCNSNDDTICFYFIPETIANTSVRELLKKFMRNLKKLSDKNGAYFNTIDKENNTNKRCTYLKYWFYDQIISKNYQISDEDMDNFFDYLERLKYVIFDTFPCDFYKIKLKDIKEIKKLYDYFVFYDAYKIQNIINHQIYNSVHCHYLKGATFLYKEKERQCNLSDKTEYCKEFSNHIQNNIEKNVLLSLRGKCKGEKVITLPQTTHQNEITLHHNLKKLAERDGFLNDVPLNEFYNVLNYWYNDSIIDTCICKKFIKNDIRNVNYIRKLCNNLKDIIKGWKNLQLTFEKHYKGYKYCDYMNYWLHDKIKSNISRAKIIQYIYNAWDKLDKKYSKDYTCSHKNFNVAEYAFKRKKELFEFLEYYDKMKVFLYDVASPNHKEYCDYVKNRFALYFSMEHESDTFKKSSLYTEEIKVFKEKFNGNNELNFLKEKCPGRKLELVFNKAQENVSTLLPYGLEILQQENKNLKYNREWINLKEKILEELPSDKIYKNLNSDDNIDQYFNGCVNISLLELDYPGITRLCKKLRRNLKKLSTIDDKKEHKERCFYFKHWLYEEIRKIFLTESTNISEIPDMTKILKVGYDTNYELTQENIHKNYNLLHKQFREKRELIIKELLNQYTSKKKGTPKSFESIKEIFVNAHDLNKFTPCLYNFDCKFDECGEMKHLHDYFENYDSVICNESSNIHECKKIYCDSIPYINKLYAKHIGECCTCYSSPTSYCQDNCKDYFRCNQAYNPHNLYSKLKCKEVTGKELNTVVKPEPIDKNVLFITQNSQEKGAPLDPVTKESIHKMLTYDPFYIFFMISFVLLGIFFLFFVFYKFTPFGSLLHKKLNKKKNDLNFYEENTQQLLPRHSKHEHTNTRNKKIRIAYNSQ